MSSPSASDEVAAGDGALRTCSVASASREHEVVDQRAVACHRLGAHPGRPALDVGGAQLGHVARAGGHEGPLAGGHAQLVRPGAPEAPRHPPGPRPAQPADEHRRRPEQHVARDVAREVHAEERQVRIGHRVDEAVDEPAGVRAQAQVLPAEGDDARVLRRARRHRQAAGLPAGAEDRVARGRPRRPPGAPRRCRARRPSPRARAPARRPRRARRRPSRAPRRRSRRSRCWASAGRRCPRNGARAR